MDSRIRELRVSRGMKQDAFADIFGISQQTVSRIEKNPESIATDLLIKVAAYFHVTTDYLLGLTDEKRNLMINNQLNHKMEEYYELIIDIEELSDSNKRVLQYLVKGLKESQN